MLLDVFPTLWLSLPFSLSVHDVDLPAVPSFFSPRRCAPCLTALRASVFIGSVTLAFPPPVRSLMRVAPGCIYSSRGLFRLSASSSPQVPPWRLPSGPPSFRFRPVPSLQSIKFTPPPLHNKKKPCITFTLVSQQTIRFLAA